MPPRATRPGPPEGTADMSTVTRETSRISLPKTGRGDALLALAAVLACLLALVVRVAGIA
jgi:LPXTG-motif cell wall-anchored protein